MKIGYVVPYVDGTDQNWLDLFLKNAPSKVKRDREEVKLRYSPNSLFKYHIRSIDKFAPWISTLHLLVWEKSQVPNWIDDSKVHIVCHRDFIPSEHLPTFNSGTIECFLHRIPQLEDLFIYANDDMYFMNNVAPNDFFSNAMPLPICNSGINTSNSQQYDNMCKNMTKKIFSELNMPCPYGFFMRSNHTHRAFNKAIYSQIFNRFSSYILKSCSMFRSDINVTESFFNVYYYLLMKKKYKNTSLTYKYYSFETIDKLVKLFTQKKGFPKSICINNNNGNDLLLLAKMQQIFPAKSKYEK